MNNFDNLLANAKQELLNEECVKEYFRLKKELDSNDELKSLDKEMKMHQKKMCENQDSDEIYKEEKSHYESCKEKLENNPVWINFQTVKEEVYSLLVEIKSFLS